MSDDLQFNCRQEVEVNHFTEESAKKFRKEVLAISDQDPERVIAIHIDSYGGYVASLAKMIETMDEVPNKFVTVCQGKAMSCGAILFSHGDYRFVGKHSQIMVHNFLTGNYGDMWNMVQTADEIVSYNEDLMGLLAKNCGITYKELQTSIKATKGSKDLLMDAATSVKFGIADYVGTPVVKPSVMWTIEVAGEKVRGMILEEETPKSRKTAAKKAAPKKAKTPKKAPKKTSTKKAK